MRMFRHHIKNLCGSPQRALHQHHSPLGVFSRRHYYFSFWKNQLVDNTSSQAHDILATERTFLAWARTGLGFVGAGSALAAAYHRHDDARQIAPDIVPASALLIGNGAFLLAFATRRYYTVLSALMQHNKFPVNALDTILAVMVTSAGTVGSLWIVWRAEAKQWEHNHHHNNSDNDGRKDDNKETNGGSQQGHNKTNR